MKLIKYHLTITQKVCFLSKVIQTCMETMQSTCWSITIPILHDLRKTKQDLHKVQRNNYQWKGHVPKWSKPQIMQVPYVNAIPKYTHSKKNHQKEGKQCLLELWRMSNTLLFCMPCNCSVLNSSNADNRCKCSTIIQRQLHHTDVKTALPGIRNTHLQSYVIQNTRKFSMQCTTSALAG
jgi:hypothetical protein